MNLVTLTQIPDLYDASDAFSDMPIKGNNYFSTPNYRTLVAEGSCLPVAAPGSAATGPREPLTENVPGHVQNNYVRPEGQNVGNVRLY